MRMLRSRPGRLNVPRTYIVPPAPWDVGADHDAGQLMDQYRVRLGQRLLDANIVEHCQSQPRLPDDRTVCSTPVRLSVSW